MKSIILLIAVTFASHGNCAEKVGGIMGLTLGRKFYPPSAKSGCKLLEKRNEKNESCAVYVYELPSDRGILKMNTVTVEVTPKSGIICGIWARTRTNEFPTLEKAKTVLNLIVSRLEEKHGKAVKNCIERGSQHVSWTVFENWGTRTNSKGEKEDVVSSAMIVVTCGDRELYDKAGQEREEMNGETSILESF